MSVGGGISGMDTLGVHVGVSGKQQDLAHQETLRREKNLWNINTPDTFQQMYEPLVSLYMKSLEPGRMQAVDQSAIRMQNANRGADEFASKRGFQGGGAHAAMKQGAQSAFSAESTMAFISQLVNATGQASTQAGRIQSDLGRQMAGTQQQPLGYYPNAYEQLLLSSPTAVSANFGA